MWILFFLLLSRIYQDAKMVLIKDYTTTKGGERIEDQVQGDDNKNLLELTPSDFVFYVGGYPAGFTVSSTEITTSILLNSQGF